MTDDDELELEPFDPAFAAAKEAELIAAIVNAGDAGDLLDIHPFGGEP